MIDYKVDMKLELWIKDAGMFDGFAVFVDGSLIRKVGDQITHKSTISRPSGVEAIAINFGGQDGGVSAVVDVTDPNNNLTLEKQTGINHAYMIQAV